jgi:hypothetical protein
MPFPTGQASAHDSAALFAHKGAVGMNAAGEDVDEEEEEDAAAEDKDGGAEESDVWWSSTTPPLATQHGTSSST